VAIAGLKGGFPFISFLYSNSVVGIKEVDLAEGLGTIEPIKEFTSFPFSSAFPFLFSAFPQLRFPKNGGSSSLLFYYLFTLHIWRVLTRFNGRERESPPYLRCKNREIFELV
jgi:hypothetical protein